MRRPIVLTGPPASGKSTLAPALAARCGTGWADLDAEIEREAGRTVAEIFATEGEPSFRARERRAFERLLGDGGPGVIAAGGGALLERAFRHRMLSRAWVLSLEAPLDVLVERASRTSGARPLLAGDVRTRLATLLEARASSYAEAHASVSAGEDTPRVLDALLDAVRELEQGATLVMPLGLRSYRVHVAPLTTLAARVQALAPSATVLVTDARVKRALGDEAFTALAPRAQVVLQGRGERDKTLTSVRRIWDAALEAEIDRDALVVGVGGGVVTDLAGFAASTLLRGVRYASAPTTLLAMADASVGGKTGFDHPSGKNLLGAFHQPAVVVCDPRVLSSLTLRQRAEGVAEIAKIALVRDANLFADLMASSASLARGEIEALASVLPAAIQAKIDVVARDEREAGERAVLNFGHTLGHAIERAADYRVPHGECVALGMRAALDLGVALGITPRAVAEEALALLDALALPSRVPAGLDRARVLEALRSDKKRKQSALRFVLCDAIGSAVTMPVPWERANAALDSL